MSGGSSTRRQQTTHVSAGPGRGQKKREKERLALKRCRTWLGSATGKLTSAPRLRQNAASVSTFPMCLSRACPDKLISFIFTYIYIEIPQKGRRRVSDTHPSAAKRAFFIVFPMFVPSLSWQNDRFHVCINGSKKPVFSPLVRLHSSCTLL
jgi:hypothetical protein